MEPVEIKIPYLMKYVDEIRDSRWLNFWIVRKLVNLMVEIIWEMEERRRISRLQDHLIEELDAEVETLSEKLDVLIQKFEETPQSAPQDDTTQIPKSFTTASEIMERRYQAYNSEQTKAE